MSVQLIAQDSNDPSKLYVCEEGISMLHAHPETLKVVCIAGLYRSGKSYLLNRLIGHSVRRTENRMFKVGESTQSCTRGIWMFIKDDIVYLDTEGLASVDQDETHDTKIFCLGLLLSSYFVYNSVGVIDESALDRLYMVGELTQRILQSDNHHGGNLIEFQMMWLLRDFALSLKDFNDDPNAYLEDALKDNIKRKSNDHRRGLRAVFTDRCCRTLVRPLTDESQLQKLDELSVDELRPEFTSELASVIETIQSNTHHKTLNGQPLNGPLLVGFLQTCVEAINNGAVPNIKKSFEYIAEQSHTEALKDALNIYKQLAGPTDIVYPDWMDFIKLHENARQASLKAFEKPGVLNTPSLLKYRHECEASIRESFESRWQLVDRHSATTSRNLIESLRNQPEEVMMETLALDKTSQCGPNYSFIAREALSRDIILHTLQPRIKELKTDLSRTQAALEDEKTKLSQNESELKALGARLALSEREVADKTKDLEHEVAKRERVEADLERERKNYETTAESLREQQKTSNKTLDQLHSEQEKTARLNEELQALRASKLALELEISRKNNELQEIIELAGTQQDQFDAREKELENGLEKSEIRLILEQTIFQVETDILQRKYDRVMEERNALHVRLQDFFMRASTLPDFYQSMVFCEPTGLVENW